MRRLAPEHLKRCDKYYTHICVALLEGAYEGLVFNATFKLLKYQKKNSALWITSKLIDHVKRLHLSLKSVKFYMTTNSINAGERMSSVFTNGFGWHANSPQF